MPFRSIFRKVFVKKHAKSEKMTSVFYIKKHKSFLTFCVFFDESLPENGSKWHGVAFDASKNTPNMSPNINLT